MAKLRLVSRTNNVVGYYDDLEGIEIKDRRADMSTGIKDSNNEEIYVNDYIGKDGKVGLVQQDRPEQMVGVGFYVDVEGERKDEFDLIVDEGWIKIGDVYGGY